MKINDYSPPAAQSLAAFNVAAEAPPPPEIPVEVHAGFSLTQLLDRSMQTLNRNLGNGLKIQFDMAKAMDRLIADSSAQAFVAEFLEQAHTRRIRHLMHVHQMRQCATVFQHCAETLPAEQQRELEKEKNQILERLALTEVPPEIEGDVQAELESSSEFFEKLIDLIDLIKNGYLAGYEYILDAYSGFFADFNTEITAKMRYWISGGINDGKDVQLNTKDFLAALDGLFRKYSFPSPDSVLYPDPKKGGVSWKEADDWRKTLGLPDSCLQRNADGTYCVVIDLEPLWTIRHRLPSDGEDWAVWDNAKFQAWQTGFNAQDERLKNMLQSLTQKYSNANSYHDNFNKTLSSHLNQYADMLKAMLNF